MDDPTRPISADIASPGSPAGTWPRGALTLGLWLFGLALVALLGCFLVNEPMIFFLAGGLAMATITVGLITAIGGAIGGGGRPALPRPIDHRALRGGLLLMLGGFALGFGTSFAMMLVMARNWH